MTPAQIKDWVLQKTSALVRYARVTRNSANGMGDAVDGHLTYEDEAPGGYDYTVRRLWPFGIRSRPPVGCDAVVVHAFGGSTNGVMVGAESSVYGPSDLVEGEVAIYAKKAGAVIKIDVNGKVTIDAPNTTDVVVNGGTKKVARVDDTTNPGVISLSSTGPVAGLYTVTLTYTNAAGTPTTVGSWTTATVAGMTNVQMAGKITSGADHFKG